MAQILRGQNNIDRQNILWRRRAMQGALQTAQAAACAPLLYACPRDTMALSRMALSREAHADFSPKRSTAMALPQRQDPTMEALIQQALEEIKQANPRFATGPTPLPEEELAQLLGDEQILDQLWQSPEGQRAQQMGFFAADAVNEDRGE
jgi:hypothetical protein